jgi:hypothetical protein
MTKLIAAFRDFANAPKNATWRPLCMYISTTENVCSLRHSTVDDVSQQRNRDDRSSLTFSSSTEIWPWELVGFRCKGWLTNCETGWLIDWLTDRLTDWLTDWHTGWLTDWLIDWLTDWLTDWQTDWLTDTLADWLTDWLTDWQTDWLTDTLADWLTYWLTDRLTDWLTDWHTGWLIDLLTDWQTEWLNEWLTDWPTDRLTNWLTGLTSVSLYCDLVLDLNFKGFSTFSPSFDGNESMCSECLLYFLF